MLTERVIKGGINICYTLINKLEQEIWYVFVKFHGDFVITTVSMHDHLHKWIGNPCEKDGFDIFENPVWIGLGELTFVQEPFRERYALQQFLTLPALPINFDYVYLSYNKSEFSCITIAMIHLCIPPWFMI